MLYSTLAPAPYRTATPVAVTVPVSNNPVVFTQALGDCRWLQDTFHGFMKTDRPIMVGVTDDTVRVAAPIIALAGEERPHLVPFLEEPRTPQDLMTFGWQQQLLYEWRTSPHKLLTHYTLRRVVKEFVDNDQIGLDADAPYHLNDASHPAFALSDVTTYVMQQKLNTRKTRFGSKKDADLFEDNFDLFIQGTAHYQDMMDRVAQAGLANTQPSLILKL